MADLRALVAGLGAEAVGTYLQSGNVVFRSATARTELRAGIERALADELGLEVAVLLRTPAELERIAAGNPFAGVGRKELHVAFLSAEPDPELVEALGPRPFPPDELRVAGEEAYLRYPKGLGRSKLSNAFLEKALGVRATTRNWNTVTRLAQLARE